MPALSVIVPVYRAERTIEHCLRCLRSQTFADYEVIVVESGGSSCREMVVQILPEARYLSFERRLLAHAATNRGIAKASGDSLVFLDPDAYPAPDWLSRIDDELAGGAEVVAGAVACYGDRMIDQAAHLAKFDKWLPGLPARRLTEAPTVNLTISRRTFEEYGPFREDAVHADTDLCWRITQAGVPIEFKPEVLVEHHHQHSFGSLLVERYWRGRAFGSFLNDLNVVSSPWQRNWRALISGLPLRLATQLVRVGRNAQQAGMASSFVLLSPIVASALYAWLLGEATSLILNEGSAD